MCPEQHIVAKLFIENDRGKYVRDPAGFERIISGLGQVRTKIYNDLLRIPFTQIVMRVQIEGNSSPTHSATANPVIALPNRFRIVVCTATHGPRIFDFDNPLDRLRELLNPGRGADLVRGTDCR